MDEISQPGPAISESELLAEIKLSITQAKRGQGRPAQTILAEAKARYTARFGNKNLGNETKPTAAQ